MNEEILLDAIASLVAKQEKMMREFEELKENLAKLNNRDKITQNILSHNVSLSNKEAERIKEILSGSELLIQKVHTASFIIWHQRILIYSWFCLVLFLLAAIALLKFM